MSEIVNHHRRPGSDKNSNMMNEDCSNNVDASENNQQHSHLMMEEVSVHLFDLIDRYPIYQRLLSNLSLKSVITLTATCRKLRNQLRSEWDVDSMLKRFVKNPMRLRSELGRQGSIIAGSFALQFMARVQWSDVDLDIVTERGPAVANWERYLREEEGYHLGSTWEVRPIDWYLQNDMIDFPEVRMAHSRSSTAIEIREYWRPSQLHEAQTKIHILVTCQDVVATVLGGWYMTAILNIVTWNKAYALFPQETFFSRKTYMLKTTTGDLGYFAEQLTKYNRRGWTLGRAYDEHDTRAAFARNLRRIGDKFTWTIDLGTDGVELPVQPDSIIESSIFSKFLSMSGRVPGRGSQVFYTLNSATFRHIALKYTYSYTRTAGFNWARDLSPWLHECAFEGLMKMKSDDQPKWFKQRLRTGLSSPMSSDQNYFLSFEDSNFFLERPEGWKTYDSELQDKIKTWWLSKTASEMS